MNAVLKEHRKVVVVAVAEEAVVEEEEEEEAVDAVVGAAQAEAVHSVQVAEWALGRVQFGHMFGFLPGNNFTHKLFNASISALAIPIVGWTIRRKVPQRMGKSTMMFEWKFPSALGHIKPARVVPPKWTQCWRKWQWRLVNLCEFN